MQIHSSKLPIHSFEPAKDFGLSSIATSASWNFFMDGTSRMLSPRCPWIHEHIVWSVRYPQPHPCLWYFIWINIYRWLHGNFYIASYISPRLLSISAQEPSAVCIPSWCCRNYLKSYSEIGVERCIPNSSSQ